MLKIPHLHSRILSWANSGGSAGAQRASHVHAPRPDALTIAIDDICVRRPELHTPLAQYAVAQRAMPAIVQRAEACGKTTSAINAATLPRTLRHNVDLLQQVAAQPERIVGFRPWLEFLGEKIGHGGLPTDHDPASERVAFERVKNVLRPFSELEEALRQSAQLTEGTVEIGCDFTKVKGPAAASATVSRSFDVQVRNKIGRIVKRIEVTSVEKEIEAYWSFKPAVRHITSKAVDASDGRGDGCIAVVWAPAADRHAILSDLCRILNERPSTDKMTWRHGSDRLDGLAIIDNQGQSLVYAIFTKQGGHWSFTEPSGPCSYVGVEPSPAS